MPSRPDSGFTLLEVMVTIALAGAVMGFAVSGWGGWSRASAHEGAAVELQGLMRQAQQRAVTTGTSLCLWFEVGSDAWRLDEGACSASSRPLIDGPWHLDDRLDLLEARFTAPDGSTTTGATFTPRGTASPGKVRIGRDGSSTVHEVRVEGLTGRVSIH